MDLAQPSKFNVCDAVRSANVESLGGLIQVGKHRFLNIRSCESFPCFQCLEVRLSH